MKALHMPITYRVDADQNFVHTMASEIVSGADIVEHVRALATDSRVRAGYRELLDARAVTSIQAEPDIFDQMAAIEREYLDKFHGHKVAILTMSHQVDQYARAFERRTEGNPMTVIVFTTLEVALTWLHVTPA